jgi:UDP-N-acetylglucosamine/UDP-N-acetylgalactosamine diphosphorylase
MLDYDALKVAFGAAGQGHVFRFWDRLDERERPAFLDQLRGVDLDWLAERIGEIERRKTAAADEAVGELKPAPVLRLPHSEHDREVWRAARRRGEEALAAGQVAAFVVAGGQGTRLGFEGPKGVFPIGPCSDRSLFQIHAEKILALGRRYGRVIPWYLMTSQVNHRETVAFFEAHGFFGLDPDDVMFFQQGLVPSVDEDGKLLLEAPGRLALSPNGHGGSLLALVDSGAMDDMQRRGIDTISYFQVDNPLVTICDPTFLGHHLAAGAQMSSKVLEKAGPDEKVGVICLRDGRTALVEYSDLDDEHRYATDHTGRLVFWTGSPAIHMIDAGFARRMGSDFCLPYHLAHKKIAHLDARGEVISPEAPNGFRFETFVFDALPHCDSTVTMEVTREEEFAPVKNASGVDSPRTCRRLMSEQYARWMYAVGIKVPRDAEGRLTAQIEISPLDALEAADLAGKRDAVTCCPGA